LDRDNEKIILGTFEQARSAMEINRLYGIPIADCFKKMRALEKMGLLEIDSFRYSHKGKKILLYKANLQDAYVFYESGKLKVRFEVVLQMTRGIRSRLESRVIHNEIQENIATEIHA
jgi:hypothetical protein